MSLFCSTRCNLHGGIGATVTIKTPAGPVWLTIPCALKENIFKRLAKQGCPIRWAEHHWKTLTANYGQPLTFPRIARCWNDAISNVTSLI